MKLITKNGYEVLIDEEDFEKIKDYTWCGVKSPRSFYVQANKKIGKGKYIHIKMHRLIMGINNPKIYVDHKNFNGLDNRKENLRLVTPRQNSMNRRKHRGTRSKYKGVFPTPYGSFQAMIRVNGILKHLGCFKNPEDASNAYINASKIHFGEYASEVVT